MWLIWGMLIVGIPLLGLAAYAEWNNRQARKYDEWEKQQKEQENNIPV
jgi:hypothetical protein